MAGNQTLAMRRGGKVPGHANVSGNSSKNDTVKAMLSPGEIVIPRTHSGDPEKAKQFIEQEFAKRKQSASNQHLSKMIAAHKHLGEAIRAMSEGGTVVDDGAIETGGTSNEGKTLGEIIGYPGSTPAPKPTPKPKPKGYAEGGTVQPQKFSWDSIPDAPAAGNGAKFNWDALPDHPDSGTPSRAETAIQGFGNMASAGYIPELTAAAGALLPNPNADVDAKLKAQGFKIDQPEDTYAARRDASRVMQAKMAKEDPVSYYGGGAAGAIATAPLFGAALKGLGIGTKAAALAGGVEGPVTRGAQLAQTARNVAAEGAALGLASNPNTDPGEEGFNAGRRALNAVGSGFLSGALPVAGAAVKGAANGAGSLGQWAGTKLLSSFGSVKPAVISEYTQFPERINGAKSVEALKGISDDFVGKLSQDVADKKLSADQAQGAFDGLQSDLKDAYKTAGYDARDAVTSAQQSLKDAHAARIEGLSSDVYDTVAQLKSDVQKQSGAALKLLDKSGEKIDLAPVAAKIDETIARLKASGTDESLAVADRVEAYKKRLMSNQETKQVGFQPSGKTETISPAVHENDARLSDPNTMKPARQIVGDGPEVDRWAPLRGKEVTPAVQSTPIGPKFSTVSNVGAAQAKKLIQGLDQITEYSPMAGSFDKAKNAAFKDIRSALDQQLKGAVPEYRAAMEPVAADAKLLDRVQGFGDKQTAAGLLKNLDSPTKMEHRAALEELGNKYGTDFIAGADAANLPEQIRLNQANAAQDALRGDRVAEKIGQTLAGSREKAALDASQVGLSQAKERLSPFKSLAPNSSDQTQAQQKLAQLGKGGNIELTDMFTKLGKLTDTDFVQAMHDNNIQDAFKKGAYNGSRNAVRFGSLGGAVGFFMAGIPGGAAGSAGGANLGALVDQWGPAITKKILDGAIKFQRSPTAETIRGLGLPDPIKRNLVIGLQKYASQEPASMLAKRDSKVNRSPAVGEDRWAQQGVQNLGLDSPTANRLMQDPRAKSLLIRASDLKPGSQAMKNIMNQIQKGWVK